MKDHILDRVKTIKSKIEALINEGKLEEAREVIQSYEKTIPGDFDIVSMKSVILIMEGKLEEARRLLQQSLEIEPFLKDMVFNLAYVHEQQGEYQKAYDYYLDVKNSAGGDTYDIDEAIQQVIGKCDLSPRKRIAFFVKRGMDSFLDSIITGVSGEYHTKKIIVEDFSKIDEGMKWADICWFEWCDELVAYGSRKNVANEKTIICRLHSYEAFTGNLHNIMWDNVDKIIFVAEHIRNYVLSQVKDLSIEKTIVIPNGIDVSKYMYRERTTGFKIGYVGYINYKKGPMLLLHTFKAIYDRDSRYRLYIAGQFQDGRDLLYFQQMIPEMGLQGAIIYEGWQNDIDKWLEDKDYILCTSILESQNISVMQAMCKGVKPVIHNFVGAKNIYPGKYVWSFIEEAVGMILNQDYNSKEYRDFITERFLLENAIQKTRNLIKSISINSGNKSAEFLDNPIVTIGIINYNCKQFLNKCVESFLNQTYKNIEILLIDDCSTDGSKEMIQELEKKYNNIRGIYHKSNSGGASKGIKEIIAEARGKYFQWISSDDFAEQDVVERFVNFLENNSKIDYVYSNYNIVDENNKITGQWRYSLYSPDEVIYRVFHSGSGVIPMNCMYRKEFFLKNDLTWTIYKGNDYSCDVINTLYFLKNNMRYKLLDVPLINYRVHPNNCSHNLAKRIKTSVTISDFIINNFSEVIFFPDENWLEIKDRKQYKYLLLGKHFLNMAVKNISLKLPAYIKNDISKEEMLKYVQELLNEGMLYVEEGSKIDGAYNGELKSLEGNYKEYLL